VESLAAAIRVSDRELVRERRRPASGTCESIAAARRPRIQVNIRATAMKRRRKIGRASCRERV